MRSELAPGPEVHTMAICLGSPSVSALPLPRRPVITVVVYRSEHFFMSACLMPSCCRLCLCMLCAWGKPCHTSMTSSQVWTRRMALASFWSSLTQQYRRLVEPTLSSITLFCLYLTLLKTMRSVSIPHLDSGQSERNTPDKG
ncbi:hypothetical protein L227DRAFT_321395 [Lentinus tigrinus ALCF2SS1-6]|uniref:Uncharacterized protein n=1 Tax=Lentinus tigrinus ALCF2SS1-6 TaxID=1328759 RepID=A0A5C2SKQ1_9APHY|nr:hypothetical protein L227DRAFT_321395 [Lentinus tigrinus ALCF2SS1-6]